jgi:hypothetical protein
MTETSEIRGFAADWLALREPADHASRNREVQAAFLAHMTELTGEAVIVDMGAGTGSTARALAPAIAKANPGLRQSWVLVDADSLLIDRARQELADLIRQGIGIDYEQADLSDRSALDGYMARADVVTGSALIDLVSAEWLGWAAQSAAEHRTALLFALNYSGTPRPGLHHMRQIRPCSLRFWRTSGATRGSAVRLDLMRPTVSLKGSAATLP